MLCLVFGFRISVIGETGLSSLGLRRASVRYTAIGQYREPLAMPVLWAFLTFHAAASEAPGIASGTRNLAVRNALFRQAAHARSRTAASKAIVPGSGTAAEEPLGETPLLPGTASPRAAEASVEPSQIRNCSRSSRCRRSTASDL